MRAAPRAELIWASPRELLNLVQADADRLPHHHHEPATCWPSSTTLGKDLEQFSLETVQMFHRDARRPASGSDAVKRALDHRRRRLHRLQPRRPAARRRRRGRRLRQLLDRRREFVAGRRPARRSSRATCSTATRWPRAIEGCDTVFHLQANADVRHGLEHPRRDLEQNTIATSNVLEAMRARGRDDGSRSPRPARSTASPRSSRRPRTRRSRSRPRSTRASKLAGEGLIGAYAHGFGFTGVVFRFVSILGERYTHGHVIDFYRALQRRPDAAARARRRPPAQDLPLRRRLRRARSSPRWPRTTASPGCARLQPRHRRDRSSSTTRSASISEHLGVAARARAHRRRRAAGPATAR